MDSITKAVVTQEQLSLICEKHLGDQCESAVELKDGWFNAAFLLTARSGREAVLKIAPSDSVRLMRYERNLMNAEVSVMRMVREVTDIPVPAIIAFDGSREEVASDYFLAERLSGLPLDQCRPTMATELGETVDLQVGVILASLHKIIGSRFGTYNQPESETWSAAFLSLVEMLRQDAADLEVELPAGTFEAVEPHRWALTEVSAPSLVHWDLWDGNIFVDKDSGEITGLIDFERAMWADPLIEQNFRVPSPTLIQAYGNPILESPGAKSRRLLYDLHLFLIMVIECRYRHLTAEHEAHCRRMLDETLAKCWSAALA